MGVDFLNEEELPGKSGGIRSPPDSPKIEVHLMIITYIVLNNIN